jgi:hypothetical protein
MFFPWFVYSTTKFANIMKWICLLLLLLLWFSGIFAQADNDLVNEIRNDLDPYRAFGREYRTARLPRRAFSAGFLSLT